MGMATLVGAERLESDVDKHHSIVGAFAVDGPQFLHRSPFAGAWLLCLVMAVLAGCAGRAPTPDQGMEDLVFRVEGKISVRGAAGGASASFVWWQRKGSYEVEFWGPLGSQRTRIQGDEGSFAIVNAAGERIAGTNPEALMQRELGWSVPVAVLSHWIRGAPSPALPWQTASHDSGGRFVAFEQAGWQVEVPVRGDKALPTRIRAKRGHDRIVVACRNWSFGA